MKIGDEVKIIGGHNEIGQPTMMNKVGKVMAFGHKYKVKGKETIEVYVDIKNERHVFNDYHLKIMR